MRITAPDGHSWWADIRGATELNGGDRKALQAMDDEISGLAKGVGWATEKGADGSETEVAYELSPDGVSLIPRRVSRFVTRKALRDGREALLARLLSAWSLEALPMPYQPGYLDRDEIPLDLADAIEKVLDEVRERLRSDGPKEKPVTTGPSSSTSPGEPATSPQG